VSNALGLNYLNGGNFTRWKGQIEIDIGQGIASIAMIASIAKIGN
jgi:hypothetical protein